MSDANSKTCQVRPKVTCKEKKCDDGMECCQEPNSNVSTCCAKGACNSKTGLCSNPTKVQCPSYFDQGGNVLEGFLPLEKKDRVFLLVCLFLVFGIVISFKNRF